MKRTITRAEYLQLVGLMALAERHNRSLCEISDAACELTGEESDWGHTSDMTFDKSPNADALLARLGITIEEKRL